MIGWQFAQQNQDEGGSPFDKLFKIFKELLLYTSGNVDEAISWLTQLDKEYNLTTPDYGISDFIDDLVKKGFLQKPKKGQEGPMRPSSKMEVEMEVQE